MQRLLQPLGGVICKPALAFTAPFHSRCHQQLQTRLLQLFRPASTYYCFTRVHSQLSAFSAGVVQVFVIPFPLSHTKTKAERIHFFGLRFTLNFFLPCLQSHRFRAAGAEGLLLSEHCRIYGGRRTPVEEGLNLHLGCTDATSRSGERMHRSVSAASLGNQRNKPKLKFSSGWLMAKILKAAKFCFVLFFSFQLFHVRSNSLTPVCQNPS